MPFHYSQKRYLRHFAPACLLRRCFRCSRRIFALPLPVGVTRRSSFRYFAVDGLQDTSSLLPSEDRAGVLLHSVRSASLTFQQEQAFSHLHEAQPAAFSLTGAAF